MQVRKLSLLEVILNTSTFFIIATLFQYFVVFSVTKADVTFVESLGWSFCYAIGSLIWQYMWRRIMDSLGRF